MTLAEAFLLALVQGVTEFLPISSSAHLVLLPYLMGGRDHPLTYDVVTHAGTLLAAMVYFRRELGSVWRDPTSFWGGLRRPGLGPAVAVGSVPVGLAGWLFYGFFAGAARSPALIAATSIFFGLVLAWADAAGRRCRLLGELGWGDAAAVGLAQALALVPGTSRSGITLTAGLALGFTRREAARFSFLLAIPAGAMALGNDLLGLLDGDLPAVGWSPLALGFVVSAAAGYAVIGWLLAWLERQTLTPFVVYRVALGVAVLAVVGWKG